MADELIAQSKQFALAQTATGLAKIPLLVLTADDGLAQSANSLVAAIRAQGSTRVQTSISALIIVVDARLALASSVIEWLQGLVKRSLTGTRGPKPAGVPR